MKESRGVRKASVARGGIGGGVGRGGLGVVGAVVEDDDFVDGEDGESTRDVAAQGRFEIMCLATVAVRGGSQCA